MPGGHFRCGMQPRLGQLGGVETHIERGGESDFVSDSDSDSDFESDFDFDFDFGFCFLLILNITMINKHFFCHKFVIDFIIF